MIKTRQSSKSRLGNSKHPQQPLVPIEWSEPRIWGADRLPATYLLEYPFSVVLVRPTSGDGVRGERPFASLRAARTFLGLQPEELTRQTEGPMRRYGIVVSKDDLPVDRSVRFHSYIAVCATIERLQLGYRLAHALELDVQFLVDDARSGSIAAPDFVSDLGASKDLIYAVACAEPGPPYVVATPHGTVGVWTGDAAREEYWENPKLLSLYYEIKEWPTTPQTPPLPEYTIARVENGELVPIANGYHSMLYAARTAVLLQRRSGLLCAVWDGSEPHFFDHTVFRGDVVRMHRGAIECFQARVAWNKVALDLLDGAVSAPIVVSAQ